MNTVEKYLICIFAFIAVATAITSLAVFGVGDSAYKYIWILPVIYLVNLIFLTAMLQKRFGKITVWSTIVLLLFQTVVFPLSASLVGDNFSGRRYIPLADSIIAEAILVTGLGNLFFVCLAFVIHAVIRQHPMSRQRKINFDGKRELGRLIGSRVVYYIFIIVAAGTFLLVGLPNNLLSLFFKFKETVADPGPLLLLARQVSWAGVALAYVIILELSARSYRVSRKHLYFLTALGASVLITGVIYGDRRSMQLFTGILSIYLLIRQFPDKKNMIFGLIGSAMAFTVISVSIYRIEQQGGTSSVAFLFSEPRLLMKLIADYVQIYYGGVDSVALGIHFARAQDISIVDMFFDFGRTIFGLNFLLKDEGLLLSQQYNVFIYDGDFFNGQLLFAVSYGVALFGILGAPLFLVLNFTYSLVLEKWLKSTRSIEMQFLLGFCLLRVATNQLVNTPTINSVVTLQFMTLGLVIFMATALKKIDEPFLVRRQYAPRR